MFVVSSCSPTGYQWGCEQMSDNSTKGHLDACRMLLREQKMHEETGDMHCPYKLVQ